MGVVLADFNNDGWTDIAIANDPGPIFYLSTNAMELMKMCR